LEQIEILFQDEYLIAINKPAGLLTIQDGYKPYLQILNRNLTTNLVKFTQYIGLTKKPAVYSFLHSLLILTENFRWILKIEKSKKNNRAVIIGDLYQDSLTIDYRYGSMVTDTTEPL